MDIEALLRSGQSVQITPRGNSMFPLFSEGRGDAAVIKPIEDQDIRVGAVVLYRRDQGILVIHRVCKRDRDGVYFVGDNQTWIEGPLRREQLLGVMTEFIRWGKRISVKNPVYAAYSRLWLMLRPIRPVLSSPVGVIYRAFKKK